MAMHFVSSMMYTVHTTRVSITIATGGVWSGKLLDHHPLASTCLPLGLRGRGENITQYSTTTRGSITIAFKYLTAFCRTKQIFFPNWAQLELREPSNYRDLNYQDFTVFVSTLKYTKWIKDYFYLIWVLNIMCTMFLFLTILYCICH